MQETNISHRLIEANRQFIQLFSAFNNEQINEVPFKESWTPAQVAEHIIKSEKVMLQALTAPGNKIDRKPDAREPELRNIFLNFTTKLQSPDFIIPEQKTYTNEGLHQQLTDTASQLAATIDTIKKEEAIADPALGELTKEEIIYFLTYHTQRHIYQLQHIQETLNDKTKAMEATQEVIVRNVNDAFKNNDIPAFLSYCTRDIRWNIIGQSSTQGKDSILQMMAATPGECPDIAIDTIFSAANKTACTGTFTMVKNEGENERFHFCDIYEFKEDEIQTLDSYVVAIKQ